jgi:adenosylcobyric acid synthase
MHIGRTTGTPRRLLRLANGKHDGAINDSGTVAGCYIHGLLSDDRQRHYWLKRIGVRGSALDYEADVDATLDRLADHIEKYLDCDRLLALAREPNLKTSSSAAR